MPRPRRRANPELTRRTLQLFERMAQLSLTKAELARKLGVTPAAVALYGKPDKYGQPVAMPRNNLAVAESWLAEHERQSLAEQPSKVGELPQFQREHHAHTLLAEFLRESGAEGPRFEMLVDFLLNVQRLERQAKGRQQP